MIKKLNKREKTLLVSLAIAVVLYGYLSLALMPVLNGINDSKANIDKYNEAINSQNLSRILTQKDKKQLSELKNNIEKSLAVIPYDERNPEIAYNIKALSDNSGVSVVAINFGRAAGIGEAQNTETTGMIMNVPVTIQITGGYKNITDFIYKLENQTRLTAVDNVTIRGTGNDLQASISINYIYMPDEKQKDVKYDFNNGIYGKDDLFK